MLLIRAAASPCRPSLWSLRSSAPRGTRSYALLKSRKTRWTDACRVRLGPAHRRILMAVRRAARLSSHPLWHRNPLCCVLRTPFTVAQPSTQYRTHWAKILPSVLPAAIARYLFRSRLSPFPLYNIVVYDVFHSAGTKPWRRNRLKTCASSLHTSRQCGSSFGALSPADSPLSLFSLYLATL